MNARASGMKKPLDYVAQSAGASLTFACTGYDSFCSKVVVSGKIWPPQIQSPTVT